MFAIAFPGFPELLVVAFLVLIIVWPVCRIVGRTGNPWPLGLLILIPIGNIALLFFLAFADWPALKDSGERLGE